MNERFYYERDPETKHPIITVCVLSNPETGEYARGVAYCSPRDSFRKPVGRAMAKGRAMSAMIHKEDREITRYGIGKGQYNPDLTSFERSLFNGGK